MVKGIAQTVAADAEALERFATEVFLRRGVPPDAAREAAALLLEADRRDIPTHGIARLPAYAEKLRTGEVNPHPALRWTQATPAVRRLHGDGGLGQVVGLRAAEGAAELARAHGVGVTLVEDCGHLGALGAYARRLADQGLIAFGAQNTPPVLVPPGAARAAIGNNPIAFAAPLPGGEPIVLDMAMSVAARGNVLLAAAEGRPIPRGWAVDAEGRPTTDAQAALAGGMRPIGAHKGIGLAMMVDILAGVLTGSFLTAQPLDPTSAHRAGGSAHLGAFFLALDASALTAADFLQSAGLWAREYARRAGDAARFPGQHAAKRAASRAARTVAVSLALQAGLAALAQELGLPLPF